MINLYNNNLVDSKNDIDYSILIKFTFSLFYSFSLIYLIPVDGSILDRMNYLEYAGSSEVIILRNIASGYLSFLVNEPIWLLINILFNQFVQPEVTVRIIIFFASFVSCFLILKSNSKHLLILFVFLVFPNVLIKYIIHLRQGLAVSFFLLGWFSSKKHTRLILFFTSSLIHSSFFFVLLLYLLTKIFQKIKISNELSFILVVIFGLVTSLLISSVSNFLGARQGAEYNFNATQVSGFGFLFWSLIFTIFCLQGKSFITNHLFELSILIFYLSTYFLIDVTGRIFESVVILILLAGVDLTKWRKLAFFYAVTGFVGISWLLSLNKSWFGWGLDF